MYRPHLTRNLRTLAFLLIILGGVSAIGLLWWANRTGLPESWRVAIEQEVAKRGAHVKIGGLSYDLLQGIVATEVKVYSEPERLREISRLERVILDFDKTKLARGIIHLNKIQLAHAGLELPLDPKNPNSEALQVTDASGLVFMPGGRRLEIRNAHGKIAGIDVKLNALMIGYQQDGKKPPDDSSMNRRRALVAKLVGELEKWHFSESHPPALQISVEGDVNDWTSITAKLALHVKDMEKNGHRLNEVVVEADMTGELLTVTSLRATDSDGVFEGHIDYNMKDREGRFDISSSLEVPNLLTAWLGLPAPQGVGIGGKHSLQADGDFLIDDHNAPKIRMTGHARCEAVTLREVLFESVASSFSWREGSLFLRDLRLARPDGHAEGKAMIEWPLVRLGLRSTLPVPVYQKMVGGSKLPIEAFLNDLSEREGAAVDVSAEGGFDASNKLAWAYTGSGKAKNLNYRGVPVNAAGSKFSLDHHELDFQQGSVVFNYTKYALHKAFNGASEGTATVSRIRYDAPNKLVEVEDVSGAIWAAPMVRLFAPKIADSLEQYRFHQPPELRGSGVVDVTPQGRTALNISFSSEQPADYLFLGENLTLGRPRAQVSIRGERVTISNLKLDAFDGPVAGNFEHTGGGKLQGELNWTRLSVPALTSAYGFEMKGGGTVTGRLAFSLTDGKVESMDGDGLVALEQAELFAVPMLGPLTPLIGSVLNDERAGFQRAKNAFCTFTIRDGILRTNDFKTSTSSLDFAGEGSVNLKERTLDMVMRMNARGLLGLITLPLRPFSGLFQFHGTGPLKDTQWESTKVTQPFEDQEKPSLAAPRAKVLSGQE